MGLSEVQHGLARLLTDEALREQFAADPEEGARTLNLTAEDAMLLNQLATAEVERFARSLRARRWNEVQKLLPLSTQAAEQFGFPLRRVFLQFAQAYVPQGSKRHAQDAIAFAQWAAQQPKATFQNFPENARTANAAWLPDLLRYEAAWLEMQRTPTRRWMLRRFAYPVPGLARALRLKSAPDALPAECLSPRTTLCAWLYLPFRSQLQHYH